MEGRLDLEKVRLLRPMLRFSFACLLLLRALTIPDLHAGACSILQG